MRQPYISVIVATYRRCDSLKKALLSLTKQTYSNFEIIVVDDNGSDEWNYRVQEVVQRIQATYQRIQLKLIVNSSNMGSAQTRNIGIENAVGEYVTFLDDDDVYLPTKLASQIKGMLENNADYSLTDLYLYNDREKLIDRRFRTYICEYDSKTLLEYHLKYHMTGTDTFMFKKEYINSIGGFGVIDVGDEFYLMQRAIQGGGKLYYQPECNVKAYVHTGEEGLSSGQGKIDGENVLYQFKKTFFSKISAKSRRYIRMRHYAVLAFAGLRMKKLILFIKYGVASVCCAPFQCVKMCVERKR